MALLESIRNSTQSGLSYIMVGVLIVFFAVFFGVPADGCRASGGRTLMASVAGDDIYTEDVNIIMNRYWGGSRTVDEETLVQQRADALKVVIATHLVAQKAEEAGLRVSDEEFAAYIVDPNRNPEFLSSYGQGGTFDGPFYERYVQFGLQTPIQRYEHFKRKELLALKYLTMLDMQVSVSADEIAELNDLKNTRVNLEFVRFAEDALVDLVGVTDEDIDEFLTTSSDEISTFYNENLTDYQTEEQVRIRRIYIVKPGEDPGADEARETYDQALRRVNEGEDFASVARDISEDYAASQGGLMDWNSPANMDQNISAAIADAEIGDVREVETDFAYMLVKLEERQDAETTPLEEVEREIARTLLGEVLVATRGQEAARTLHDRVADGMPMEDALEALRLEATEEGRELDAELWASLTVQTTGFFSKEGPQLPANLRAQFGNGFGLQRPWYDIPRLGANEELALMAFEELTPEEPLVNEVVELPNARAVVQLLEREEPGELTPELTQELRSEVRIDKVSELLGPWELLFLQPMQGLGSFVENIFGQGVNSSKVRLFERNSRAAALVREMAQEGDVVDGLLGEAGNTEINLGE